MDVVCPDFSKAFDCLPQYYPREADSPWLRQIHSSLDEKLAGWPGPENAGEHLSKSFATTNLLSFNEFHLNNLVMFFPSTH